MIVQGGSQSPWKRWRRLGGDVKICVSDVHGFDVSGFNVQFEFS